MTIKNKKIFKKRLKNAHELCIIILLSKYGEMAERSKAAVLKTVEVKASWGSNPYLSAKSKKYELWKFAKVRIFSWSCYGVVLKYTRR